MNENEITHKVVLEDGTVGLIEILPEIGQLVVVWLNDENGMPICAKGTVSEILG